MGTTGAPPNGASDAQAFARPLPEYVDWLVGVATAVGGIALAIGGSVLAFLFDQDLLEAGIDSGQVTVVALERELTEAQLLELALAVVNWTGLGLLVTGLGLVLFAGGYVAARHRARRRAGDDERVDSSLSYAVLGAVVTAVLSFVPFSPVLGGGVAGYLEYKATGRSIGVGGLAGFLSVVPGLILLVFVTAGLYTGLAAAGGGGVGLLVATALLLVLLVVAAYGAGGGALGGFVGGRLAKDD